LQIETGKNVEQSQEITDQLIEQRDQALFALKETVKVELVSD